MRIAALIHDSKQFDLVSEVLMRAGHRCHRCRDYDELLAQLLRDDCDLLVLESADEHSVAARLPAIRSSMTRDVPILLLTTRLEEDAIAASLSGGMVDYLVKPVRRGELVMRISVLLKRGYPALSTAERMVFGKYAFEPRTTRVALENRIVALTRKEFDLALLFFNNLGRPLSRAYILDAIWTHDPDVPSRTMDTHVSRIRNKLALRPENGYRLTPVYSYGYQLEQIPE